jgi:N-acetylmuramoyl-L-alanine amidase
MINKLTILNGMIQDQFIDRIPVKLAIIEPSGNANVRTLIPMTKIIGITNHNTGNSAVGATAQAHAEYFQNVENADEIYVSAHLFVDDESIIQILPLNEIAYHAGDGKGDGNYHTLSIEICENKNNEVAEENAKKLNAALLLTYGNLKLYKHQDWSGKFCPRVILSRPNGWQEFCNDIYKLLENGEEGEDMAVVRYNTIEEVPEWSKATIQKLIDKNILNGSDTGLNLSEDMIRILVINDRAGLYN